MSIKKKDILLRHESDEGDQGKERNNTIELY
jgi:hypothetical protein